MYLQKDIIRKTFLKNNFLVGILKVNDENSRIRNRIRIHKSEAWPRIQIRIRIHIKMLWFRNTARGV
jgi:hypothetical protein